MILNCMSAWKIQVLDINVKVAINYTHTHNPERSVSPGHGSHLHPVCAALLTACSANQLKCQSAAAGRSLSCYVLLSSVFFFFLLLLPVGRTTEGKIQSER